MSQHIHQCDLPALENHRTTLTISYFTFQDQIRREKKRLGIIAYVNWEKIDRAISTSSEEVLGPLTACL